MADQVKVKVGVEQSGLKSGLAKIRSEFGGLKKFALGKVGGALGAIGIATGAAAGVKAVMDQAGQLADLSAQFDVSAESIQRIGALADQSGVSLEGVAQALNKLAVNGEKIADGDKLGADALNDLGINAADFVKLDTEGKFNAISAAVSTSEDQGKSYAAVVQLMGKSAGELYSTLALGPDAIKAQGDAIGVMTDDTVAKLDALGDKLTALKNKFMAFGGNILGKIVGAFIGDDDPDVKRAEKERKAKAAAARGERSIEDKGSAGSKKTEVVADALTRAGGGGIAYLAPEKELARQSAQSLKDIAASSKRSEAKLEQIASRIDPMRKPPTPPTL